VNEEHTKEESSI